LIEDDVVGQYAVFVCRKPRPCCFSARKILRVNNRRHPVADTEHGDLLAFVDDFAGCIVARYPKRDHWPRIAAVGNVRVPVVERDGVDFDQYLRSGER
jgi:hypothetical protein